MTTLLTRLWVDDGGALLSLEWLLLALLLVFGIITGLVAVRQAMISELVEMAQAIMSFNQSFSISGQSNCEASTAGSSASDTTSTIVNGSVAASNAFINQTPCD
jgi:hypothetical protein